MDIGNLVVKIGADYDDLEKGIGKVKGIVSNAVSELSGLGNVLGSVVKTGALVAAGAIAAVTAAIGGLVYGLGSVAKAGLEAFIPFQKNMNEVFSLLPGISDEAQKAMSADALQLSKDLGVLPGEVIPAMYEALSAGVPQDNIFEFMKVSGKAAIAGATDQKTAVDLLTSVVNAYGSDVIDATKASDILFQTIKLGKTNADELAGSLYNVTPTASSLGIGLDQVGAALAAMTAQGVPTSVATTQLRQLMLELGSAGGQAFETFQKAAGVTFPEFLNQGHNLNDALKIMEGAAGASGVKLNDLFSSVEAGGAALVLNSKGGETFNQMLGAMTNSAGSTDAAFQVMDQGIGRTLEKIQVFGQTILIEIGEKLAPTFQKLLDVVLEVMPQIEESVLAIADQAVPILNNAVDQIIPIATQAFGWIRDTGVPWIAQAFQTATPIVSGFFTWITTTAVPFLTQSFQSALPKIQMVFGWFRDTALPWIMEFASRAGEVLTTFFGKFDSNFGPSLQRIQDAIKEVAGAFGLATGDKGVSGLDAAIGILKGGLGAAVTLFDLWSRSIKFTADQIKPVIDGLKWLYDKIKDVLNLVPGLTGPMLFGASGGRTFQQLGFAQGGSFVVPPGFPNDSFPIGVSSGEYVSVTPAGETNNYDQRQLNMTINSRATQESIVNSWHHAVAALS